MDVADYNNYISVTLRRIAGGNEPASGLKAIKQLYASGMAGASTSVQPAPVNKSNTGGYVDDDIEEEYLPKKAAAPEVCLHH